MIANISHLLSYGLWENVQAKSHESPSNEGKIRLRSAVLAAIAVVETLPNIIEDAQANKAQCQLLVQRCSKLKPNLCAILAEDSDDLTEENCSILRQLVSLLQEIRRFMSKFADISYNIHLIIKKDSCNFRQLSVRCTRNYCRCNPSGLPLHTLHIFCLVQYQAPLL